MSECWLQQFRAEGCAKVYREKASGAQTNRAQLAHVFVQFAKGDVLTVTRLNRLARSTREPDLFGRILLIKKWGRRWTIWGFVIVLV